MVDPYEIAAGNPESRSQLRRELDVAKHLAEHPEQQSRDLNRQIKDAASPPPDLFRLPGPRPRPTRRENGLSVEPPAPSVGEQISDAVREYEDRTGVRSAFRERHHDD